MKPHILTDPQRHALHVACRKPGAIIRPPFTTLEPKREITRQMAGVLAGRELVTIVATRIRFDIVDVAVITRAGSAILAAPMPHEPRYLRERGGGYTTQLHQAMRDEGEGISLVEEIAMAKVNERNRRIGYQRVHEIQVELDALNAALERLAARGDLGAHAMKRVSEMRRQRDKLIGDLAA